MSGGTVLFPAGSVGIPTGLFMRSPATQAGLDLKRSDTPTTVLGNVSLVSNTVI